MLNRNKYYVLVLLIWIFRSLKILKTTIFSKRQITSTL